MWIKISQKGLPKKDVDIFSFIADLWYSNKLVE